jgi:pimeloyl-ACP methyl ester carboxylesterase
MKRTPQYKIPPPGKRITVGDNILHVDERGEGSPTVIFENGLSAFSLQWYYIQAQIAQFTHTLSYDRAGQGWSDASTKPRTPQQITVELHQLLETLNVKPPYILVSHSFGGLISRYYAQQYPSEVQALVLVDTSHEMQLTHVENYDRRHHMMLQGLRVMSLVSRLPTVGQRLATQMFGQFRGDIPDEVWQQIVYLSGLPKQHATTRAEMLQFNDFFGPSHIIPTDLGDLPIVVITAAESMLHAPSPAKNLTSQQINQLQQELQRELLQLSTNSQQIIVPGATHLSVIGNPAHAQVVVDAVRRLVQNA